MGKEERLFLLPRKAAALLLGESSVFSFEARIYNSVNVVTMVWLLVMSVGNYLLELYEAMLVTLLMVVIQLVLYYFCRVKGKLYVPMTIHGILSYLAIGFNYYYNSGINGPTIFLFFICAQLLFITTPRRQHILWLSLSLMIGVGLLVYEYLHPTEIINTYLSPLDRYIDISFCFCFTFCFTYYLTISLRRQFEFEREQGREQLLVIEEQVAQLRESEARLKAFFQNTGNIYILLDKNLNVVSFNKVASALFGRLSKTPLVAGENIFSFISGKNRTFLFDKLNGALNGENQNFEMSGGGPDALEWWEVQLSPVVTDNGSIAGVSCTCSDITERKNHEQIILSKNEALLKIAHYQSHDMRGPVTSIMGLLSIIDEEKEQTSPEVFALLKKAVITLDAQIHRVIDLTDALDE